jgi:hypothetical protein
MTRSIASDAVALKTRMQQIHARIAGSHEAGCRVWTAFLPIAA